MACASGAGLRGEGGAIGSDVRSRLQKVLADALGVEPVSAGDDHDLVRAGLDLHTAAAAASAIERAFGVRFSPRELIEEGTSLATLADAMARCTGDPQPSSPPDAPSSAAPGRSTDAVCGDDDLTYWTSLFSDGAPALALPLDRPRRTGPAATSEVIARTIDAALASAIARNGAADGTGVLASLLGTFAVLLSRLSGQDEVVVGLATDGLILGGQDGGSGVRADVLPLKLAIDHAQPLRTLMHRLQGDALDAISHGIVAPAALAAACGFDRDAGAGRWCDVVFGIGPADPAAAVDVALSIRVVRLQDALRIEGRYDPAVLDEATVQAWLDAYQMLLRAVADEGERTSRQSSLVDVDAMGRLQAWQPEQVAFDRECLMHERFERQCDVDGGRIALVHAGEALTYAQLEDRSNRIAGLLRARGVGRGALVGIALERTPWMPAAVLAVLKSGAGYVPLDPGLPPERLVAMVHDAGLGSIITDRANAARIDLQEVSRLVVDDAGDALAAQSGGRIGRDDAAAAPASVAYVIYTSGSTGKPKGVAVPHRAVANLIDCTQRWLRLGADDVVAAVTPLSFDPSVVDLCLPLAVGARIVIVDRDTSVSGAALRALLERSGATYMDATPSGWRVLLGSGWEGRGDFKAICGGEAMPADVAAALLSRCGEVWNMYGPTETTVTATGARIGKYADGTPDIHIGRPVDNTRVWIVDRFGHLCPPGVPGEMVIAGEGVALGYLDRPEQTLASFVPDTFPGASGATPAGAPRMYRTGDRGRWRHDGNLAHLGRLDFQIKVRGYRIEPGDIEAALRAQPDVVDAVAMVREDVPGDVRLVAYAVLAAGSQVGERALADGLKALLPPYMIPQHIVLLAALPLSPNGKLERAGLPAPQRTTAAPVALGDDAGAAERIAATMGALLDTDRFGLNDDFFASGGHSLLAARLGMWIEKTFGVPVTLRTLFDAPTPSRLAEVVTGSHSGTRTRLVRHVPRRQDQSVAPLSLMQQRLWLHEQLQPDATNYMIASAFRLRGPLDPSALDLAFQAVVRRQPALRTCIDEIDGVPVQRIVDDCAASLLPIEDLTPLPADARHAEFSRRVAPLIAQPLRTSRPPLFRARLFALSAEEHLLFFQVHHVAWDAVSVRLFWEEMAVLYAGYRAGEVPELPPLARSYADFAAWHAEASQGDAVRAQLEHWIGKFADAPEPLQLPEDHPRPAVATGRGGSEIVRIGASLAQRLQQVGAARRATMFMTLLAAYFVLLHRTTGHRDLVVGLPIRDSVSEDLDRVMGFFANVVPMRLCLDPAWTFSELLERVREGVLECFANPDVPFEELVRALKLPRDYGRSPLYQAQFSMGNFRDLPKQWGDLLCEDVPLPHYSALTDLSMWVDEGEDGLLVDLNYNADILGADSGRLLTQRWLGLLDALARSPDAEIGEVHALSDEDRRLLDDWNATTQALPAARSLPGLLSQSFVANAARVAVRFEGRSLTYAELDARSDRIADALVARGVQAGARVGVCLDRHLDLLATMLAVLKAGAAYVPLDPAYPVDRLQFMVEDAALLLVVSEGELAVPLSLPGERLLLLDRDADEIAAARAAARAPDPVGRDAPAYVIYTSGSTGKPKGVVVPHGAVVNFLSSMAQEPGLTADDRLLAVTTTSFDISVLELFLPLSVGARVVLASRESAMDGQEIAQVLEREQVTVMQATPSTWYMLLDGDWRPSPGFKVLCGGEALSRDLATQLLAHDVALWNMYGPTETTVWSTCTRVAHAAPDAAADIHIGRPIANTTVWVLDARGQVCPVGVSGELCIGGAGVTLGYLDRDALTAEKFIADGVSPHDHGTDLPPRLYRTGDRGRWRVDGVLEHQGRMDFQVKVRGHRIELGEIEDVLQSQASVARAVVVVREDRPGDMRLVGYVAGFDIDQDALYAGMRAALPGYMVPQRLVSLQALPLLPNGKVDRKALPAPGPAVDVVDDAQVHGAAARYLAAMCSDVIGTRVRPEDNFFDAGGHSLLAVKLINRLHRETGVRLNLVTLASSTIAQLAEQLPAGTGAADARAAVAVAGDGTTPVLAREGERKVVDAAVAASPAARALHFGDPGRRLFGVLHAPRGRARSALLLCPPLLHEHVCSYRMFSSFAGLLADAGVACLRFDYHGTGDSDGDTTAFHPARVAEDIAQAARVLRAKTGDVPLVVMGVRASAMFVPRAVRELGASAAWLWQPALDPARYLRELDALDAAERSSKLRYPFIARGPLPEAGELMGFRLPPTFREELLQFGSDQAWDEVPTTVLDAAAVVGAVPGAELRLALPRGATNWVRQVEIDGVVPQRVLKPLAQALLSDMAGRA